MDNNKQMPPVQPANGQPMMNGGAPMNGQPMMNGGMPINGQSMDNMMPQNEVSRILMSQGSMPGGPVSQGQMPNGTMSPNGGAMPTPQNSGMTPQGVMPQVVGPDGRPMVQQPLAAPPKKKDVAGLVKTIVIIALSLLAVTFIGLFIWMKNEYETENSRDLDGEIELAVAASKDELTTKMENEFVEREKYPYKSFSGPIDYGELSFEYPKTWSVYVAEDAVNGGTFSAYFNPGEIEPISNLNIDALRVQIVDRPYDDVVQEYTGPLQDVNRPLTVESITVNGTSANLYTGAIPGTEFKGFILVLKIRDKTAILRTDSVLFEAEFRKLIETITFNA